MTGILDSIYFPLSIVGVGPLLSLFLPGDLDPDLERDLGVDLDLDLDLLHDPDRFGEHGDLALALGDL